MQSFLIRYIGHVLRKQIYQALFRCFVYNVSTSD